MYKRLVCSIFVVLMLMSGGASAKACAWYDVICHAKTAGATITKAAQDFNAGFNAFKNDVSSTVAKSYFWAFDTGIASGNWVTDTSETVWNNVADTTVNTYTNLTQCRVKIYDPGISTFVKFQDTQWNGGSLANGYTDIGCGTTGSVRSYGIPKTSGGSCVPPSRIDGCSFPTGKIDVSTPVGQVTLTAFSADLFTPRDKNLMKPACVAHDTCYNSLPPAGINKDLWKAKCDAEFWYNMNDVRFKFKGNFSAETAYAAVVARGQNAFDADQTWAASNSCQGSTRTKIDPGLPLFRQAADMDGDNKDEFCRQIGTDIVCDSYDPETGGFSEQSRISGDLGYVGSRWLADVNGDGKDDYCREVGDRDAKASFILCDGDRGSAGWGKITTKYGDLGYKGNRWFADVNGDGRDDYCREVGNRGTGADASSILCEGYKGSAGWGEITRISGDLGYEGNRWFADVNGDGRDDYCREVGNPGAHAILCTMAKTTANQQAGFKVSFTGEGLYIFAGTNLGYKDARWFADVNNDGKQEYCREVGGRGSATYPPYISCTSPARTPANMITVANISWQKDIGYRHPRMFGDFTGDGQTDYLRSVGSSSSRKMAVLSLVNGAPVADAGAAQTLECSGGSSANATLNGAASSDPDSDPLTYAWSWAGGSATGVSASASFPIGTTNVTLTVDDGNGHTATATTTVTVQDTTAPTVNAGADVVLEATNPAGEAFDVMAQATATDTCCSVTPIVSPAGPYSLGTTSVTVSATDCANNTASDVMLLTVQDTTPPALSVPANVSVEANAVLSTVNLGVASATDIFGATVTNNAPASFPLGTTTVTYTATDGNGLTTTGTQTVTVVDTTAPVLSVPADVSVEANAVLSTVAIGSATATDIFPVTITSDAPTSYALGTTVVTWKATDANGNATTGTQNVTVVDTTAPVLTVPADVSVEANAVLSTVNIGVASATDIFGATVTNDAPATYPVGTTVVTYTAVDGNGLTTIGTQNVTVVDTTAPTVTASLVAVNVGDDDEHGEGMFQVVFSASDIADPNPVLTATLNGATVTNGQNVKLEQSRKSKWEFEHGKLEIKGMSFSLDVTATDASGNVGTAAAAYAFPVKHEAKKHDHKKSDKKHKKSKKHKKHD